MTSALRRWRSDPRAGSVRSRNPLSLATMDLRVVLVAAPIVLAASWAVFHIGRAAVGQLQLMLKRARA
jgi:photosystem II PsbY protein